MTGSSCFFGTIGLLKHYPNQEHMSQSAPLYDTSEALALLDPWLRQHLPALNEAVCRRFIQLVTGIFEQRSLLLEKIAESSVFTANETSNATQVRRIIRDERLTLESVYYPFLRSVLAQVPGDTLYVTLDETSHADDYCVVQVGWATDGISIPLGFLVYAASQPWADDARELLQTLDEIIPQHFDIVLLADRVHTGEPFLSCLDELQWSYVFRAPEDTLVEHPRLGWVKLRAIPTSTNRGRYLNNVRVWKGGKRCANISIYKHAGKGFRAVVWYLISDLPAAKERFAEYACRWWQECTFKDLKSAMFEWERGRVTASARVYVLLMGVGCALWALWLLGRAHERTPKCKPSTKIAQKRRHSIVKHGSSVFRTAVKRKERLQLPPPPAARLLDYPKVFEATPQQKA